GGPRRVVTPPGPRGAGGPAGALARPGRVLAPPFERAESPRTNRSNSVGWRSPGMPGPVSVTLTRTAGGFSAVATATVTVVPSGVCFAALLIRLASTW